MFHKLLPTLNLRFLILLLVLLASIGTLVSSFYATYQVQKEQLINYTLHSNYAYANKLASATDSFLEAAMQQLAYSANKLEQNITDDAFLKEEAARLKLQTNSFNSVVINIHGISVATYPNLPLVINKPLGSVGALQARKHKKPIISMPYMSAAGNLIVFISHPLFSNNGDYLGYLGGSLYLNERSILNNLLEQDYFKGGTHIYVVDKNKQILYHPQAARIGSKIAHNKVINKVIEGQSGSANIVNSLNESMLAGYAPVKLANWGVVVQRSVKSTLSPLDGLVAQVIKRTLPTVVITLILIGLFAHFISKPLKRLADIANRTDELNHESELKKVKSWYFESQQLKTAMLKGESVLQLQIGQLRHDAQTDPLTGLHNRRSLKVWLDKLIHEQTLFTILEIDIDFFKRVNDTYGHDKGDETLKALTVLIQSIARKDDIVARIGGEEFVLVIPNQNSEGAFKIAERLRLAVESSYIDTVGYITISIGIASYPEHGTNIEQVFKKADNALYYAKEHGRNRSVIANLIE
ncbi:sensor domain-containing diguanylate cyclase [Pseudoalteromonas sp. SCQQ13]|uniref:sensor domain-containing diguanylate cyclase n=1 Tax=Pseudoalteromonas sp. SCQQ13 TaxID=2792066 RepID=UPI002F414F53